MNSLNKRFSFSQILILLLLIIQTVAFKSISAQTLKTGKGTMKPVVFPYRGWSICLQSNDRDLEERYVKAADARAAKYGINTLEMHDYVMPGGIVEALVQFDSFPKLNKYEYLTYDGVKAPKAQKKDDLKRFRKMISLSDTSLKINAWYHVMRDLPEEIIKEYPEITDLNSGFLWKYIDYTLTEFFRRVPEVDRLTLISLHETPSILKNTGNLSREETLLKLYMTIYDACRRAGKELIIRDFIVSYQDYQTFWNILDKIPPDVYVMTKSISADWSHLDMGINPIMNRYKNRKLIVEFDLYGEWSGRGDFPVCYPEDIYRHIREMKALNAVGGMGRLIHDERPGSELPFPTIFESPVGVNAYTFAKALSEPIPWLGETAPKWDEDLEAIDKKYWMIWARERYGDKPAVPVVRALERTSDINKLTFDLAGISFRLYVWYPTFFRVKPGDSTTVGDSWRNFITQVQNVGIDYLKDEKHRALEMAERSLKDIQSVKGMLSDKDYKDLEKLFRGMILIVRSYNVALDGYYQVYLSKQQSNTAGQKKATQSITKLADEIDKQRGKGWYFDLANEMRILAKNVEDGKTP